MSDKNYAFHLVNLVSKLNPDHAYVAGFLAGYLSSLMEQDPIVYKQFVRHLSKQSESDKKP